jgi:hypothetical protein
MRFCKDDCKYLSITEEQQQIVGSKKNPHICTKYNYRVYHMQYHPQLVRLGKCDEEDENDIGESSGTASLDSKSER